MWFRSKAGLPSIRKKGKNLAIEIIKERKSMTFPKFDKKIFFEIIAIALPLMLTYVLQQFYNTSDAIIVGRGVGDTALSAVGASTYIILILTYLFIGLTVGASINVAQAFGAKNDQKIKRLLHTGIAVSLISGGFLSIVGYFGSGYFLKLTGVPSEVLPLSASYLKIYFCGVTFSMLYNMGSAILRGIGNTKVSLYCLMASTLTNIALDLLFVFYFKWGIKSVAVATISSQFISCAIVIGVLLTRKDSCKLILNQIKIHREETKEILRLGLPSGTQSLVQNFSNLYVQTKVYTFGAIVLAGVTAYVKVEGFFYMIIEGIASATGVLAGQLYGRNETEKIPQYIFTSLVICAVALIPLSLIYVVFAKQIISLLITDPESIRQGVIMTYIIVPLYFVYGISQTLSHVLRGLGYAKKSMKVVLIFTCGFRVIWVTLAMMTLNSIIPIHYVYPASWALTASVFYYEYKKLKEADFMEERV